MGAAVLDQQVDLAALEAAVQGFCAGFDAGVLTATEAADLVVRLTVLERRVAAVKGRSARRVEISSAWRHAGHRSMAEWLAARTGDPVGVSVGVLDTAKKLDALPATAEAVASGQVSLAAAREIGGAVAADPTAEVKFLAMATGGSGHRELVDSAAKVRQARLQARRFARTHTDADAARRVRPEGLGAGRRDVRARHRCPVPNSPPPRPPRIRRGRRRRRRHDGKPDER
jgi:hypothetical protein